MPETRKQQLAYSESQGLMLDEKSRRAKAAKLVAVLKHFLGRDDFVGLTVADVGCSGGTIASELRRCGAQVVGLDIDRPGLAKAAAAYGEEVGFACGDSAELPLAGASVDVVICNHVYEHVVSPVALFRELRRVVRPEGVIYLGLASRLGILEPHYRLLFLSWLPRRLAHRYVRLFRRADHYHEALTTRRGLRRLCAHLYVWDYTLTVIADPVRFKATEVVPKWARHAPPWMFRVGLAVAPTYLWIATVQPTAPRGVETRSPPRYVCTDADGRSR